MLIGMERESIPIEKRSVASGGPLWLFLWAARLHWKHLDQEFWERTFLLQKGVEGYLIL